MALLNDLFGIQARGGCSCAGPYAHRLLDIDADRSQAYAGQIDRGLGSIKPGWARVSVNYFTSENVFAFILDAVDFVANHGHRFLPHYTLNPATGLWRHREWRARPRSLHDIDYASGALNVAWTQRTEPESALPGYLGQARRIADTLDDIPADRLVLDDDYEHLRWFALAQD